jgi:hypothetical protein
MAFFPFGNPFSGLLISDQQERKTYLPGELTTNQPPIGPSQYLAATSEPIGLFSYIQEQEQKGLGQNAYVFLQNLVCPEYTSDDDCPICREHLSSQVVVLTCRGAHKYHFDCITKWYEKNLSCPLCRDTCAHLLEDEKM